MFIPFILLPVFPGKPVQFRWCSGCRTPGSFVYNTKRTSCQSIATKIECWVRSCIKDWWLQRKHSANRQTLPIPRWNLLLFPVAVNAASTCNMLRRHTISILDYASARCQWQATDVCAKSNCFSFSVPTKSSFVDSLSAKQTWILGPLVFSSVPGNSTQECWPLSLSATSTGVSPTNSLPHTTKRLNNCVSLSFCSSLKFQCKEIYTKQQICASLKLVADPERRALVVLWKIISMIETQQQSFGGCVSLQLQICVTCGVLSVVSMKLVCYLSTSIRRRLPGNNKREKKTA